MEPSRERLWASSWSQAHNTRDLSYTSQGPSSMQMEVICLRLCTDFTNNYVILGHTHSHITSSGVPFPLTQAVPRIRNQAGDLGT